MSGAGTGLQLALLSAALMGFRHGFDYDHIAAITDITSVQVNPKRAMRLGLLYALRPCRDCGGFGQLGGVLSLVTAARNRQHCRETGGHHAGGAGNLRARVA